MDSRHGHSVVQVKNLLFHYSFRPRRSKLSECFLSCCRSAMLWRMGLRRRALRTHHRRCMRSLLTESVPIYTSSSAWVPSENLSGKPTPRRCLIIKSRGATAPCWTHTHTFPIVCMCRTVEPVPTSRDLGSALTLQVSRLDHTLDLEFIWRPLRIGRHADFIAACP